MPVVPSGKVTVTVEPGSPVPEAVSVPLALGATDCVGASGGVVSVKLLLVAGDVLPAASVWVTEMVPVVCGVAEVTDQVPFGATVAVPVVPSGKVTVTVEPGSPVPEAVSVPLAFGDTDCVGANGGVVSVKAAEAWSTFDWESVCSAITVPDVWGVAEVTEYVPPDVTVTVAVVPSGKVTTTVAPGSPEPATVSVPSAF